MADEERVETHEEKNKRLDSEIKKQYEQQGYSTPWGHAWKNIKETFIEPREEYLERKAHEKQLRDLEKAENRKIELMEKGSYLSAYGEARHKAAERKGIEAGFKKAGYEPKDFMQRDPEMELKAMKLKEQELKIMERAQKMQSRSRPTRVVRQVVHQRPMMPIQQEEQTGIGFNTDPLAGMGQFAGNFNSFLDTDPLAGMGGLMSWGQQPRQERVSMPKIYKKKFKKKKKRRR